MATYTIEVDFEAFKALTALRTSEDVTYNDVVHSLLPGSTKKLIASTVSSPPRQGGLTIKGVHFPEGTEFRAKYKGSVHTGTIENGKIVVNGRSASTPSRAATQITGNNVDGWKFWSCRLPGTTVWKLLKSLQQS